MSRYSVDIIKPNMKKSFERHTLGKKAAARLNEDGYFLLEERKKGIQCIVPT